MLFLLVSFVIRRPPSSTLFPSRRSSDLVAPAVALGLAHDPGAQRPPAAEGRQLRAQPVQGKAFAVLGQRECRQDRKSTRLNSSHSSISYAVFCLKKKKNLKHQDIYYDSH